MLPTINDGVEDQEKGRSNRPQVHKLLMEFRPRSLFGIRRKEPISAG